MTAERRRLHNTATRRARAARRADTVEAEVRGARTGTGSGTGTDCRRPAHGTLGI